MKTRFKLKSFVSILLLAILFLVPLIAIPIVKNTPNPMGYAENTEQSVILELWNVDTFEGGSASKSGFLQKMAMQFKSQNNQVFIIVKNLDFNQAKTLLENNHKPDMVSFGMGAGELFLPFLTHVDGSGTKPQFLQYGEKQGKQLCAPWCMGAYVLCSLNGTDISNINSWITFENKNLVGFGGENNVAMLALNENKSEIKFGRKLLYEKNLENTLGQYQAYKDFVAGKFDVLVGTQRDYVRTLNRVRAGVAQCSFNFLGGFSDLMQWFGILKTDGATQALAESFLAFLLSSECQQQLSTISMFSVTDELIYMGDSTFSEFEKKQKQIERSLNAFLTQTEILDEQKKAVECVFA